MVWMNHSGGACGDFSGYGADEIPVDHPVFHFFRLPRGLPKIHEHEANPSSIRNLPWWATVVFYSYESDLGDGWEDEDVPDDPLKSESVP
ncbi:MAG: hypothetical protein CM1200mP14_09160 [Gammaproteobacteria bacterium]|nr:MAG: hypothetical protein CM1200mP14_09160 [Gammaproteobacteria bacterium]